MSYDIGLVDKTGKEILLDERHALRGGTFEVGGTKRAWLNITYNYAQHFKRVFGERGIRALYGLRAADTIPMLMEAVALFQGDRSDDYWEPTEGNARAAIVDLMALAGMAPDGIWHGD